ncbi:hypothetical protein [Corynebacterium durum]|uniref:hypothetical protein n=1 Tax=Corynebacterium durum TaxID=61592 RepID=UPI00288C037E|nr:hypothetical protein [Corynebacterium durum]
MMRKTTSAIITFAAVAALSGTASAAADNCQNHPIRISNVKLNPSDVSEESDLDASIATMEQFISEHDGRKQFDESAAEKAGASPFLMQAGRDYNDRSKKLDSNEDLPGYGNWCGPGHSGPGNPVDTIDSLCQKHDKCYGERGYFACSCDREMVEDIRNNRGKFRGFGENAMALAAATHFKNAPCNPLK